MSSSIPSWQILTAHAQPFREARDLAFCLKVPLHSLLLWASSGGSGETARMRRLAWTFAARIGDKYQIRLTRSTYPRHWTLHGDLELRMRYCTFEEIQQTTWGWLQTIDEYASYNVDSRQELHAPIQDAKVSCMQHRWFLLGGGDQR